MSDLAKLYEVLVSLRCNYVDNVGPGKALRGFSFFALQLTLAPYLYVASARGYKSTAQAAPRLT
jgi:hypothetical protein